ncbi:MAG: hypothetical protein SGARI_006811, partial [Bacillariaceae sp.]
MREAGITAAERYKAELEKEEGGEQSAAGVNLDVDQIMRDPGAKARGKRTPAANAAFVQAAANAAMMGANRNRAPIGAGAAGANARLAAQLAAMQQAYNRQGANVQQQPARVNGA